MALNGSLVSAQYYGETRSILAVGPGKALLAGPRLAPASAKSLPGGSGAPSRIPSKSCSEFGAVVFWNPSRELGLPPRVLFLMCVFLF